jgi:bifunctional DNA-binding transcriptional regulator/antitoxin component of YhaV-PrlF toxin-antitoxin module
MRLLGSIQLTTNKRLTIPQNLLDVLDVREGDFLMFYENEGTVIVQKAEGYRKKSSASPQQPHKK